VLCADLALAPGGRYRLDAAHTERAFYVVEGRVRVEGEPPVYDTARLILLKPGAEVVLASDAGARLFLIGGEPMPERRLIYWNFVSSRAERIEQAKADWREGRFPPCRRERFHPPAARSARREAALMRLMRA
jgi:redox-sensitive bicupin YhaK (pirin superfamily)